MKKWPIIPTIVTVLAVATMIGLGVWQLQRKGEKEAQLTALWANMRKPAAAYVMNGPVANDMLFRKSSVMCIRPVKWVQVSGSDINGQPGYRYIADCATGAEGPGAMIVAGVGDGPNVKVNWSGGIVNGTVTNEPDSRSFIEKLFAAKRVLRPMLISSTGLGGLRTAKPPSPMSLPNDHLLYAIQWFFFAAAASVIFIFAVRKKLSEQ